MPDGLLTTGIDHSLTGEGKSQISFRYYLFAILFLIFDVEAVWFSSMHSNVQRTGASPLARWR
jgi:NADH:ubiquinone oxidoreductase subunit 3 (subunit A)